MELGDAARALSAVDEAQRAAVRFGDLSAQDETDPRAARLRREERDEEIFRVRQSRSFVFDLEFEV